MDRFIELVKQALAREIGTPLGQIDLIFGLVAASLVALFLSGKSLVALGNLILRLFGRRSIQNGARDNWYAILSVLLFFLVSLILLAFSPRKG